MVMVMATAPPELGTPAAGGSRSSLLTLEQDRQDENTNQIGSVQVAALGVSKSSEKRCGLFDSHSPSTEQSTDTGSSSTTLAPADRQLSTWDADEELNALLRVGGSTALDSTIDPLLNDLWVGAVAAAAVAAAYSSPSPQVRHY